MSSFSVRFKQLREANGWTQDDVAERLGVSRSTIAGYESENKARTPRHETLLNVANMFRVTVDYLLRADDALGQKSYAINDGSPIKLSENERTMEIEPGTGWNFNNSEKVIHMALEQMNSENASNVDDDIKMIPVLGTIKAGYDLYAEQQVIGMQPVAASTISDGAEYFYLVVKGDSMIDAGIKEGMRVLVRRQDSVEQGQVAVVLVNGDEGTLKRVYYQDNAIILQAANQNIPPRMMPMDDARIQGLVIKAEFDVI